MVFGRLNSPAGMEGMELNPTTLVCEASAAVFIFIT